MFLSAVKLCTALTFIYLNPYICIFGWAKPVSYRTHMSSPISWESLSSWQIVTKRFTAGNFSYYVHLVRIFFSSLFIFERTCFMKHVRSPLFFYQNHSVLPHIQNHSHRFAYNFRLHDLYNWQSKMVFNMNRHGGFKIRDLFYWILQSKRDNEILFIKCSLEFKNLAHLISLNTMGQSIWFFRTHFLITFHSNQIVSDMSESLRFR